MVSWGFVLTLHMSAFSGLTIAGLASDFDAIRWLGVAGLALGSVGLVVLLKQDERKQKQGIAKNPRVWCGEALFAPAWVMCTIRVMLLALAVETQIILNDLAGLG